MHPTYSFEINFKEVDTARQIKSICNGESQCSKKLLYFFSMNWLELTEKMTTLVKISNISKISNIIKISNNSNISNISKISSIS